ncbi:MAG: C1 family peptidase, partial [Clostridia bacterium]|nr:C1 family peptidase [Clostridia bacterium]
MKRIKYVLSVAFSLIFAFSALLTVAAYKTSYNTKGLVYATPVEDQQLNEDCIYYALLSSAGTYCIKNNNLPRENANFAEKALKSKIGKTTNFGEVLYSSVRHDIGGGNYITSVESLPTSKAENRAIKKKINENGAVVAAIYLPDTGMSEAKYYSGKDFTFNCPSNEIGTVAHAIAIVGYDDSFSTETFLCKTDKSPGAWICKNSYGTSYGKEGYFYLSYDYPLLYAAAIEVSQLSGVSRVKRADDRFFNFRPIGAFGFKSASASQGIEIILKSGGKTVYEGAVDLIKGYNAIEVNIPFAYGKIELTVGGERINNESVYLYYLRNRQASLEFSKPSEIADWAERADELHITIRPGRVNVWAKVNGDRISLPYQNKFRVIIPPVHGIYFDENTIVDYDMEAFNGSHPNQIDNIPFSEFTEKDQEYVTLLEDGRVAARNPNIHGRLLKSIDINTDDRSEITGATLTFDEGDKDDISAEN